MEALFLLNRLARILLVIDCSCTDDFLIRVNLNLPANRLLFHVLAPHLDFHRLDESCVPWRQRFTLMDKRFLLLLREIPCLLLGDLSLILSFEVPLLLLLFNLFQMGFILFDLAPHLNDMLLSCHLFFDPLEAELHLAVKL